MGWIERVDSNVDTAIGELFGRSNWWDAHPEAKKFRDGSTLHMIKMDFGLLLTVGAATLHPGAIVLALEPLRQGILAVVDGTKMTKLSREARSSEKGRLKSS